MEIKIRKGDLRQVINLLFDLNLKPKMNRHRVNFVKVLEDKFKEVEEERMLLAKEYATKDGDDEPIIKNDSYDIKDMKGFREDVQELYNEVFVIEGANQQDMLKSMKKIINDIDFEMSGRTAFVYEELYQQFQKGGNK